MRTTGKDGEFLLLLTQDGILTVAGVDQRLIREREQFLGNGVKLGSPQTAMHSGASNSIFPYGCSANLSRVFLSFITIKCHGFLFPPLGAAMAACSSLVMSSLLTRSGVNFLMLRLANKASNLTITRIMMELGKIIDILTVCYSTFTVNLSRASAKKLITMAKLKIL